MLNIIEQIKKSWLKNIPIKYDKEIMQSFKIDVSMSNSYAGDYISQYNSSYIKVTVPTFYDN